LTTENAKLNLTGLLGLKATKVKESIRDTKLLSYCGEINLAIRDESYIKQF